jgi:anti-sigma regulatory factor (Ser/Thr protein kinase)
VKRKEYSIASDYKEVAPLCKNIRVFCLNLGFNSTECNEIEICLTEALNNIIGQILS